MHGEEQDQQQAEEEGRHGNADQHEEGDDAVGPAELADGRDDAGEKPEDRADDERGAGEDQRRAEAFEHFVEHRAVEDVGAAEIAVQQIAEPDQVLLEQGLSRPSSRLMRATFSGVAKAPRIAVAGSPGISAMIRKTMTDSPIRTGIMASRRFRM